ncbi:MAG: hypothetical protein E7164_01570 [Firmicutes bacterium]|nr:hypothetical protein [Bacillota bacterium]
MYTKNNKNGKILNILLGIIALFVIIFIIAWVVNKGSNTADYNAEFKTNLETVHENAKEYFANELPEEIGDTTLISLDEVYELELSNPIFYGKTACDETLSYVSITKINATEYKVKTNLVCGDKKDNIVEKIETNTIVDDENGNVIIDENKDKVDLEVTPSEDENGNNNDKVNCIGPVCTFTQIETTCNTTYEYEYVKRNVRCESGIYVNGSCISEKTETIEAIPNYSEEKVIISDARVNAGVSYKRYTDPIITGGESYSYCSEGTLINGYCYSYADKIISLSSSCPIGYTKVGNTCYAYADIISVGNSSCPTGYTAKNNACYKYADLITENKSSCPSGYHESFGSCYKFTDQTTETTSSCPAGYTKSGNYCYKYADLITNTTTTYSCPNGYTKTGSGANTQCLKTVSPVKLYTEWGNPDTIYETQEKENEYTYELTMKKQTGSVTIMGVTSYTYAIYSRTAYYHCSQGTLNGNKCHVYTNATKDTTSSSTCPSGYTKSGNTCYMKTNVTTSSSTTCPTGYTKSGNTCYMKTSLNTTTNSYCPTGYTRSGNTCYMKTNMIYSSDSYCPYGYIRQGNSNFCYKTTNVISNSNSTCPDGYTNNGTNCYKKEVANTATTPKTYSCPEGYNASGSQESLQCFKTYYSSDTYYCEDANATLKDGKCYVTIPSEYTGNTCPEGYTMTNNACTKTVTTSTSPIWSNAEYLYSSAATLDGYQRTGVAKFVTKCTPVKEIHYK